MQVYFEEITKREYNTLEVVSKKRTEKALPTFSTATKKVFEDYGSEKKVPDCLFLSRNVGFLNRKDIEQTIHKVENGKKHKILSLILLAATVVVAVAAITALSICCPAFLVIPIALATIALPFSISYIPLAFRENSSTLAWQTDSVKKLQTEVDSFKDYMDSEGSKLKLKLEKQVLLMNPSNLEEYTEKSRIETAINDLRLAEVLIATLAEEDVEV